MKKILVIDGNSIINRAFYGVRALTTKSGKFTNAIYGMINIISKQLSAIKPDYAAVAFDLKAPTFRHEIFPEYKAGRNPTPNELLEQFPDAKECLRLMGINILELAGYEADDIQGTVAYMAHGEADTESYILSGDRDLFQLIDDKITVLYASNHDTVKMQRAEFFEKYGIEPEHFVEMKALMGDKSDNIPGVRGIGEKGAAQLVSDFGTLEEIYDSIEDSRISKSVRGKLLDGKEDAFLSRKLSKIDTFVPLNMSLNDLKLREMDRGGLYKKFTELELNSFIVKFKLSAKDVLESENAEDVVKENGKEQNSPASEAVAERKTNTEKAPKQYEKKLSLDIKDGTVYVFDGESEYSLSLEDKEGVAKLFSRENAIACFDGKKLLYTLDGAGIKLGHEPVLLDLMIYAYVLNPSGGASTLSSLSSVFASKIIDDEKPCAKAIYELEEIMLDRISADGLTQVLNEIEIPLIPILYNIEKNGFKINKDGMNEFADALERLAAELQERIYMQAMGEFNINSPKQLGEVLYVKLGLPIKKKNNKNGFSTDAETLEELRQYSPIIDDILEYRQVTKLRGTYAAVLPKLADENSRIHTDFKQALTATGRLSSAEPNLQNIPIRTAMGKEMRRYFIPEEGNVLVDADYSQIELRLLAHISKDYNMSEAFIRGEDIHRKTAAAVFAVPEDMVNGEMRKRAKAVNFGIVYGISGFSLAKDIGTTTTEASKYIKNYLMNYPSIDVYLNEVVENARTEGYTTTLFGRRRYIPELKSANGNLRAFGKRIAMNAPIQGTAADVMKLAMIKVFRRLKQEAPEAMLVMQVHDELIVECKASDADKVKRILKEEMERACEISVPLTVDVTTGKNWLEQN